MTTHVITRLGHLGDGLTKDGIIVPGALPGEEVTGTLSGNSLVDMRIVTPSADRVKPPCTHFKSCGGCKMQHASDSLVADWKESLVRSALAAHGLNTELLPLHTSPPRSRRRATLAAKRTKKGALVGFHAKASDVIVDTPDCHLLHPDLQAIRPAAEALALAGASRKHALSLTVTRSESGPDVAAEGGKPLDTHLRVTLAGLARTHGLARLSWNGEEVVTRRPPKQVFDDAYVVPPPGAFLQATQDGETALQAEVARIVATASRVVDLFAGCGTFALPLSRTAQVHAVEGDAAMMQALDRAWRQAEGHKALTTEARDLFRRPLEPDELNAFDAAVIDPPRAGAAAQVATLCASNLSKLAYVSCNPVTFARDAAALVSSGFTLKALRAVDQFRWSAHVELVAEFRR